MTATESNQLSSLLMTAPNGTDSGNRTIAASLGLENVALNVQDVIGAMILGLVLEVNGHIFNLLCNRLTAQASNNPQCSTQPRESIQA